MNKKVLIAALIAVLCLAAFLLIPGPAPEQPQQPDIADTDTDTDTVTPAPPAALSDAELEAIFAKIYAGGLFGEDALFNLQMVLELQDKTYPADYRDRYLSWYANQPPLDPPADLPADTDANADATPPAESEPPVIADQPASSGPADTTHDKGGEKPNWDAWGGDPGTMESEPIYSEGVGDLDQTGLIIH